MSYLRIEELESRLPTATIATGFDFENNDLFQNMSNYLNYIIPGLCKPNEFEENGYALVSLPTEQYAIGVSRPDNSSSFPERVFIASGVADLLYVYGDVEGIKYQTNPFVGYIETLEQYRRQYKAVRMIAVMSAVSYAVFDQPLSSGPISYLSEEGEFLYSFAKHKYNLSSDENGQVIGS